MCAAGPTPETIAGVTIDGGRAAEPAGFGSPPGPWREPVDLDVPPVPSHPPWRRWLRLGVAAWALILVVAAVGYAMYGTPSAREQTTIIQAQPTVDAAVADLATAGEAMAVPAISGYAQTGTCDVTPVRPGARYERDVRFYTAPGGEPALLRALADRMPGRYHARLGRTPGGAVTSVTADAGDFVGVRVERSLPGEVRATVTTGCRVLGGEVAPEPATSAADRTRVEFILDALGVRPDAWRTWEVPCQVGRGRIRTVRATGTGRPALASLPDTLKHTAWQANDVIAEPGRYVFRAGGAGFAATELGGTVSVTMTTACQR